MSGAYRRGVRALPSSWDFRHEERRRCAHARRETEVRVLLLGGLAVIAIAPSAAPGAGAGAQRPPDSHDLPPPRGDTVMEAEIAPASSSGYVAPYPGWRYRPLAVGARLAAAFHAPRYVVAHPARHGLPSPRGDLRWIRYGDDALLVDVTDGRVRRVVRNRFRPPCDHRN